MLALGNAGVLFACAAAAAEFARGALERCIVLGVDSLVDAEAVAHLQEAGRLKTPDRPAGLMPGQAAAAVLVEDPRAARRRGAPVRGRIAAVATDVDPRPFLAETPDLGRALASVLVAAAPRGRRVAELYADLNGEAARAADFGHAVVRAQHALGYFPAGIELPATSLGDTGAASGAVALAAAVRSLERGYARGPEILVCSRSDGGETAAALVERPEAPARAEVGHGG